MNGTGDIRDTKGIIQTSIMCVNKAGSKAMLGNFSIVALCSVNATESATK